VGRTTLARGILGSGLVWGTVLVPGILRQDFRADLDRMDALIALPIRPVAVVVGQILPMAATVTLLGYAVLGIAVAVAPTVGSLALTVGVAEPAFALAVLAVENALFLWFPVRTEAGEAAVQSVGRNLIVSFVGWGVHGAGLLVAIVAGTAVALVTGSAVLGGLAAALPLLALAAVAVTAATVRFRRFDPSVHVPR
jgi:hypothetical protein